MINTFTIHTISYQQAMRAMKIMFVLLMMMIVGCTSQSAYKAAKGESSGYKEIALAENHYRVQFKMNGHARASAQKYALMRASELTIAQGYDWFIIEKRTTRTLNEADPFDSTARPGISRNCGLLGCRTQTQLPMQPLDGPDIETLVILEIRMGRGIRPEKESYDAREMWETAHSDKTAH